MNLTNVKGELRELIEEGLCAMPQPLIDSLNKKLSITDLATLRWYIGEQRQWAVRDYFDDLESKSNKD